MGKTIKLVKKASSVGISTLLGQRQDMEALRDRLIGQFLNVFDDKDILTAANHLHRAIHQGDLQAIGLLLQLLSLGGKTASAERVTEEEIGEAIQALADPAKEEPARLLLTALGESGPQKLNALADRSGVRWSVAIRVLEGHEWFEREAGKWQLSSLGDVAYHVRKNRQAE